MIVELAIGAAVAVAASALALAIANRRAARRQVEKARRQAELARVTDPRRGLRVGDVLLHLGDALWLAGVIELDEEGSRIQLFRVFENARARWLAQLDEHAQELALLSESSEIPEGNVPDRMPIGGRVLSLRRRGRAVVRTRGEHLPSLSGTARFAILGEAGGRLAIVVDPESGARLTLVGDRVERGLFEVLPGS
jgi:hypothetical protein